MKENFGLPKSARLGTNRHFQEIYREGHSIAGRYLVFHWRKKEEPNNKIGFGAGKKLGSAVIRNRLKRLMREAWRLYPEELPQGYDFILIARRPLLGKGLEEAQIGLREVLKKSGLLLKEGKKC